MEGKVEGRDGWGYFFEMGKGGGEVGGVVGGNNFEICKGGGRDGWGQCPINIHFLYVFGTCRLNMIYDSFYFKQTEQQLTPSLTIISTMCLGEKFNRPPVRN